MNDKTLIYLILGATGSGRREIVADLIEGGMAEGDTAVSLLSADEPADPSDAKLGAVERWRWLPENTIDATLPDEASHIFLFTDGRANPVDQIEAFKAWLAGQGAELARILCVVNCRLAEQNPRLLAWYDACIHFADVVLLNRRDGVSNKWLSDFQARFKALYYPCHFEMVKAGRVRNPALILEPQALRMSHAFDEDPEWLVTGESDDEDDDEDDDDGEEEGDSEEEVTVEIEEDPYFARLAGGRRAKEIPDIAKYLNLPNPGNP